MFIFRRTHCINAEYGTVTPYEISWWLVGATDTAVCLPIFVALINQLIKDPVRGSVTSSGIQTS
jgi:hypothetical protein